MESIFPSQDPKAIVRNALNGRMPETEEQKKHREQAESQGQADMFYVLLAVGGAILFMASSMVSLLYCYWST